MKTVDVFYQGDGITALEHIEIGEHETFGTLRAMICQRHGATIDSFLFLEDETEAIEDYVAIGTKAGRAGIKAHLHRCHSESSVRMGLPAVIECEFD